jgi:hypothetical protein
MRTKWSAVDNYMISSLIPDDDVLRQVLENNKRAGLPEHDVAAKVGLEGNQLSVGGQRTRHPDGAIGAERANFKDPPDFFAYS